MRIALIENDIVQTIVLGSLEIFPNGIEDQGYTTGDTVIDGVVTIPAPIPEAPRLKSFHADDLLAALVDDFDAIDASNSSDIKKLVRRLTTVQKAKINVEDPGYIADIGLLLPIIGQDKHDDLLLGIPL